MHVEWLTERIRTVPKVSKLRRVVVRNCLGTPSLREAVDHEALKSEDPDTAFELVCCRVWILHWQRRKSAEL
jgi:hypothetical protein